MTLCRCQSCGTWFDKKLGACDECGCPLGAHNPHAYKASLDRNLHASAERAHKERKLGEAMRSGREPDPPKWARDKAREIVKNL